MSSRTSNPFSFGIWTSRKSRSGFSSEMDFTASNPFAHSATISISGCAPRSSRSTRRANSSSSTITARCFFPGLAIGSHCLSIHRQGDTHPKGFFIARHVEVGALPITSLQAPPHIRESQPMAARRRKLGVVLVLNHHLDFVFKLLHREANPTAGGQVGYSMHHGVFNHRLQKQRRHGA